MVRVGMRVGPFYVSSSTRRRRRPSAAQRRAQAEQAARQRELAAQRRAEVARRRAERRATYGRYTVSDFRTWFSWQWLWALALLAVVATLPSAVGDSTLMEMIWLLAILAGLVVWAIRVAGIHKEQEPARQYAAQQAATERQRILLE